VVTIPFVLGSASPARLATLRSAGFAPDVLVSDVDEDALLADARAQYRAASGGAAELPLRDAPVILAHAKSMAIVERHAPDAVVLTCDSMLEFRGDLVGKPGDAATARERWLAMRGASATLHTGHVVVDNRVARRSDEPRLAEGTSSCVVHFADLSEAEIDAYIATGEPLGVAGGFTVDGLGGPFVESIEGDYHGVVGVSLPLLRSLLGEMGLSVTQFWAAR